LKLKLLIKTENKKVTENQEEIKNNIKDKESQDKTERKNKVINQQLPL
jgi:hypothetical protein